MLIIGSIDGKPLKYAEIIKEHEESIQLGNFGLMKSYDWLKHKIDSGRHKILFKHYDDYRYLKEDFSLGDYGVHETQDGNHLFFVRGGYSIDNNIRVKGKDYRTEEVLTEDQMYKCKKLYEKDKPSVVVTSTAPSEYISDNPMSTFLSELLAIHTPKLWVFGMKEDFNDTTGGTDFVGVGKHSTFTINFEEYVEGGKD